MAKKRLIPLTLFFVFLSGLALACDDSIISLVTSETPDNVFVTKLTNLNEKISLIGNALSGGKSADYQRFMESLFDAWIDFSVKYLYNPPEQANDDGQWQEKLKQIGLRIGQIRKLIKEEKIKEAHDQVFALNTELIRLFDLVKMPPLKRAFLNGAELLEGLNEFGTRKNILAIRACLGSFSEILATFTHYLGTDSQPIYTRMANSTQTLQALTKNASETDILVVLPAIRSLKHDYDALQDVFFPRGKKPETTNASSTSGEKK